jgi:hypothetical protein
MIETVIECVGCRDGELSGRRICASVVGAGLQPTLGKVVSASFQHIDRDHDVSILTAMIGGLFSDRSGVSRSNGLMTARITLVANQLMLGRPCQRRKVRRYFGVAAAPTSRVPDQDAPESNRRIETEVCRLASA